jgi:uncharacterized protein with GYD domain
MSIGCLLGKGGRALMPTYVSLVNWTDQGIRDAKETLQRADATTELAQKHGCSVQLYWTVGAYDLLSILEAPDDETATAYLLEVGSRGAVRTTIHQGEWEVSFQGS